MSDCPCTILPTPTSIAVTSGNVTFDGGATCTGFNAGDVNDFIEHISDIVCALQASLAGLSIDPADISVTGLTVLPCINPALYADFNEYIDELAHIVCEVQADLSTLVISDIGGTFDLSCINAGYGASTLQQAIDRLTVAVCAINSGQLTMNLLTRGGAMELPLMGFARDTVTITDISALGVAKVNIDATDYWINATALSMIGTNITPLVDSQDNYIFIDKDTKAYDWTAVAIGAAAPVTNGDKVAMVRTGVGTVTSITRLIGYSPIDSDILEDDSIDATKLTTTIATQPIENNGTNLVLNYDTDHLAVVANELTLATGAIDDVTLIDDAAVLNPSIEVSAGKMQVGVEDSVELDVVTGKVQLVNDAAAPGNLKIYGTTDAGAKGWMGFDDFCHTVYFIEPTVGAGTDVYSVDVDKTGIIDYVVKYPSATDNAIVIDLGTISNLYTGVKNKIVRVFLEDISVDTFVDPTRFSVDYILDVGGIPTSYSATPLSNIYDGATVRNFISKVSGLAVPSAANNQYLRVKECEEFILNYDLTSLSNGIRRSGQYNQLYVYDGAVTVTDETDNYIFN